MNIEKYKAVIFDLDGTLYDNKGLPWRLVLADIPNMWVLGAERKARKNLKGRNFGDATKVYEALYAEMSRVKWNHNLSVERAQEWYQQTYMPLQVALLGMYFTLRPLCIELLEAMKARGLKIVLYSDYGHEKEKAEALGISSDHFSEIVSAAKMGGLKPCRESMDRLMSQFGLDAETTLYVGDREDTDGDSARAVKMDFWNVKASREAWDELLKAFL